MSSYGDLGNFEASNLKVAKSLKFEGELDMVYDKLWFQLDSLTIYILTLSEIKRLYQENYWKL